MQKKRAAILGIIIVVIIVVAAFAATQLNTVPSPDARPIKIGLVACLQKAEGNDMNQAAQLAVQQINDAGGIYVSEWNTKVQVQLVVADTQDDSAGNAVEPVTRAVTQDDVDILIGGYASAGTLANEVVAMDNHVPYIVTGASSKLITERGPQGNYSGLPVGDAKRTDDAEGMSYIFHYCVTTNSYSTTVLNFLNSTMKPTLDATYGFNASRPLRLAILYRNDAFGQGVLADTQSIIASEKLPITLVATRGYTTTSTTFQTDLGVIKAAKPDAVYVVDFVANTAEIYKEAQTDVALNTTLIGVECCDDPQFYTLTAQYGNNMMLESQFAPYAQPSYMQSVATYNASYNTKFSQGPGFMGASTYDAFFIAKDAIQRAGTVNKTAVRDALEGCNLNQMLMMTETGKIQFSTGTNYHEVQIVPFMEQLKYQPNLGECRTQIVYPDTAPVVGTLKQTDFVLPDGYVPGSP